MGLIFDEHGNRMSPTYTVHRGQRYRYYTCQGALRRRDQQAGSRRHVGAEEVEALVVEMLARALPGAALGTNIAIPASRCATPSSASWCAGMRSRS